MPEKKRKRVFFLPAMFIGMGIGFLLALEYPTAFVACMFIGTGVGFLLDSIFVIEEREIKIIKPYKISSLALMLVGATFVIGGVIYLVNPLLLRHIQEYLIAIGLIGFGLFIFVRGLEGWKSI